MRACFFLACIFWCVALGCHNTQNKNAVLAPQIYALRYAVSDYPAQLVNGLQKSGTVKLNWLAYLVRDSSGDNTLVDCGFSDAALRRRFSLRNFRSVESLLGDLGLTPQAIKYIVLTHAHFDHALDVDKFPNATVVVQQREVASLQDKVLKSKLMSLQSRRHLKIIDGNTPLHTNFSVELVAGHTSGSQVVYYRGISGMFLFTGDECYFRESCQKKIPLPRAAAFSVENSRAFLRSLDNDTIVFAGHETDFVQGRWLSDYIFFFDGSVT